jgi:hypothetical protein
MAGLLAAVNPFLVYYAQETRSYSYLLCFSLLATVLLLRQLRRPDDRPQAWLPYILALTAALWSHYFALFTVALHWALVLLMWPWRERPPAVWLTVQATAGALFVPWVAVSFGVLTGYRTTVGRGAAPDEMLRQTVTALAHGAAQDMRLATAAAGFLGCLMAAGVVAALLHRRKPARWQTAAMLFLGVAIPFAGLALLSLTRPTFHPRYLIGAVPYALVLAAAPGALAAARVRIVGWALTGLTVAVMLPSLNTYFHDRAAWRADYREAAAFLNANAAPDDVIVYNAWYTRFILDYYFRGPQVRYGPFLRGPVTEEQAVEELNRIVPGHRRMWLVLWQDESIDPGAHLTAVARRTGANIGERWLGELRIFGYELPAGMAQPFRAEGIPNPMRTQFGDALELAGYRLETPQVRAGEYVRVALFWRAGAPPTEDLTSFVHVLTLTPKVEVVAQQDKPAGGHYLPSSRWQPGATVTDEFFFPVPEDTAPGEYLLEVGIYRPAGMTRLVAHGDGVTLDPTSAVLGHKVTVLPRTPAS